MISTAQGRIRRVLEGWGRVGAVVGSNIPPLILP
jgi:hypothetical protein